MASRAVLKGRAKLCLRQYYWKAFLVSLVAALLGAGNDSGFHFTISGSWKNLLNDIGFKAPEFLFIASIITAILVVILIICIIFQVFLSNVLRVGACSYFLKSRKTRTGADFQQLFSGFSGGHYIKIVKVMFMKDLIIFGWSLLLIIPGIIKSYQYAMVSYILAENPDMDYKSALKWSRDLMKGHKFRFFVLELSFIGWLLLGFIACCIGVIFVFPYQNATYAEFYVDLRENYSEKYQY